MTKTCSRVAERQAKFRQQMLDAGLVQANFWVTPEMRDTMRQAAERNQNNTDLIIGSLQNAATGKFVSLRPIRRPT